MTNNGIIIADADVRGRHKTEQESQEKDFQEEAVQPVGFQASARIYKMMKWKVLSGSGSKGSEYGGQDYAGHVGIIKDG